MFSITNNSNFQLTLGNGWVVSIAFGIGNYCSRKSMGSEARGGWSAPMQELSWESGTAEIAAWYGKQRDGNWYNFGTDQVKGWVTANEVVEFLGMISKLPSRKLTQADYEPIETALEVTYVTPV